jgi:RNA polymerase sigma factor for flagellar operon FliA
VDAIRVHEQRSVVADERATKGGSQQMASGAPRAKGQVSPKKVPGAANKPAAKDQSPSVAATASQSAKAALASDPELNSKPVKTPALPPVTLDGKVDRRALIEQYLPFVRSIAGKVKKGLAKEIEFDDLVEYGMVGLLEAASRYDPRFGANFMTFSYYRVRGAIYDGLRNMGWVSRNEYAKFRFEERANAFLGNVADRQAGSVGDDNKTAEDEVNELAETVQNLVTIFVTSLEGMEGLQLEDHEALPIDIKVGEVQMTAYVREALSRLPDQERKLLTMYYYKEMSLQEVGDTLGLSKSWTSRLHAKAVEKLSRILQELTHGERA